VAGKLTLRVDPSDCQKAMPEEARLLGPAPSKEDAAGGNGDLGPTRLSRGCTNMGTLGRDPQIRGAGRGREKAKTRARPLPDHDLTRIAARDGWAPDYVRGAYN